jgi:hypothetical protein
LNELGVPTAFDPNDGTSAGGYFLPSDIEPINQTRSDARRTYYDPYCSRPNYNILVNSQVTRILFDAPPSGASGNSSTYNGGLDGISSGTSSSTLHATAVEVSYEISISQIHTNFNSLQPMQLRPGRLYLPVRKLSLPQERFIHLKSCSCPALGQQLCLSNSISR